ncbi:hypothetical protein ACSTKT_23870, partial [Vibrio parahaemolyticus]
NYAFDATETEPPNTNSFFGTGGYAIWASDTNTQKVRGCITISSGLGSDISNCLYLTFQCWRRFCGDAFDRARGGAARYRSRSSGLTAGG